MNPKIRVRFAPSPTGPLHIGGVRTALFNYLFAKQHGGDFLLRIEDTDQTRYVPGAENYIIESLQWLGINIDEGVGVGGQHAPYRQSERKDLYKKYADVLIQNGTGYYAFDTPDYLEDIRKKMEADKKTFQYDSTTRNQFCNSLTLSAQETQERIDKGDAYVIRLKTPENEVVRFKDLIRGDVEVHTTNIDDKVLYKSDGMPTYHLANVVDDYLMQITHVIRGEEWLPSTPLHVLLYKYLGWENSMPLFSHLPLLLKPNGNGKLSKRDGDQMGFPVFPLAWKDPKSGETFSGYRESGYIAEAVVNMLAFLGWNPGTEQEIFTKEELVKEFSLEKVHKAGAKFDPEKAKWFNHHYLQLSDNEKVADILKPILIENNISISDDILLKIVSCMKERVNFTKEIFSLGTFFFAPPQNYDIQVVKKVWKENSPELLTLIKNQLLTANVFDVAELTDKVKGYITANALNMGQIMNGLRLALVGTNTGPDLLKIMEILGKSETINRIDKALLTISLK